MKCWHCEEDAKAVCLFCGRGLCAKHRKAKAHFSGFGEKAKPGLLNFSSATATHVADASWCGVCVVEYVETY